MSRWRRRWPNWVREDLTAATAALGSAPRALDNYASYDCRGRNRVAGARISEHGLANAIDIRGVNLQNGKFAEFTDRKLDREFRETIRKIRLRALHDGAGSGFRRPSRNPYPSRPCRAQERLQDLPMAGARSAERSSAAQAASGGSAVKQRDHMTRPREPSLHRVAIVRKHETRSPRRPDPGRAVARRADHAPLAAARRRRDCGAVGRRPCRPIPARKRRPP